MASLDTLLQHMSTQGATGAFLRGDAPIQLQTNSGPQTLGIVSNAQLERDIREIATPDAQAQLNVNGAAQFAYAGAQFIVQNVGGIWQLQIMNAASASLANQLSNEPNTSGQGTAAELPPQLRSWNWGAFFLSWIWAIGNSSWVGLLALIPCIGFFVRFWLGAKGNEWSWRNRRWNSVFDFQNAQRTWAVVGAILFIGGNVFMVPITAAILFPVFARARENARRASCQSNLKQIGLGVMQFSVSHGDRLPTGNTFTQWKPQIASYLNAPASNGSTLYHCPSDKSSGDSYEVNPDLSGVALSDIPSTATTPMMWDKGGIDHLDGRNVLFADGHVKWYREDFFESQIAPTTNSGQ